LSNIDVGFDGDVLQRNSGLDKSSIGIIANNKIKEDAMPELKLLRQRT